MNWYKLAKQKIIAYHGTKEPFVKFDNQYSTQGVFWFTENIEAVKNESSGALFNKYIAEVELTVDNYAGWEEYEKLYLQQIQDMGFDSIKLDDNWIIFDNNRIKIIKWIKNELV